MSVRTVGQVDSFTSQGLYTETMTGRGHRTQTYSREHNPSPPYPPHPSTNQ